MKRSLIITQYLLTAFTLISCIISISNNNIYQDGVWANVQWASY